MAAGDAEYEALASAMDDHAPACRDVPYFITDPHVLDDDLKADLRGLCHGCPLFDLCDAYARRARPKAGFWAGRYYINATKESS